MIKQSIAFLLWWLNKYCSDCRLLVFLKWTTTSSVLLLMAKNISGQTAIVGNRIDTEAEAAVHFPCWDGWAGGEVGGRKRSSRRRGRRKGARHFSSSTLRSYSGCLHAENQHTPKNDPFCSFFLQCIQTFWSKSFHLRRYWAKFLVKTKTCWILFWTLRSYYSRSPTAFWTLTILLLFLHCCQSLVMASFNLKTEIQRSKRESLKLCWKSTLHVGTEKFRLKSNSTKKAILTRLLRGNCQLWIQQ